MDKNIPANFDATQAWERDFETRVSQLLDDAAEAGLAMTVMVTYKRELTVKDNSIINEAAESTLLCARGGQHTHALMLATNLGSLFSDNPELMSEPKTFVSACLDSVISVQRSAQNIASGSQQYTEPARFNNGERVDPTKLN